MITICNETATTAIIIIHEIYGINDHMRYICSKLSKQNFDIICPNLLKTEKTFDYKQEHDAYTYFRDCVGYEQAVEQIQQIVITNRNKYEKMFLLGFSVGATVAWMCSEEKHIDGVVGYYGSRIRDHLHILPKCPVLLFYPEIESSFTVENLIESLIEKDITTMQLKGEHGFSDPYSNKYHCESTHQAYNQTLIFLMNSSI
ncbi:dienelactone hydrolase family protein [Metabacillus litoralis]|uniref:Dienelactone hydrolase family protein n=1 Tax=Metabacillus litoralis TaxID=152268 RepID=A0A5C6W4Y2_9BACI|nr:dienelactone hydrolase family protein [Metabacillus litoralis]TXC92996.1 dienelactone hydrolase family protein [Metabacillus litoralis]